MKKQIKSFFSKHPTVSIKPKMLAKRLQATSPHEYAKLKEMLHQLLDEGFLIRKGKRFQLNKVVTGRLTGKLQIAENGLFGFVVLENSKINDVFIPERHLDTAMNGDTVEVSLFATQKGKNLEGQIVNILKRHRTEITGTLKKSKSFYFVVPDEKVANRDIYIAPEKLNGAKNGDKVVVGELEWKNRQLNPEGAVIEILGKAGSYDTEISALAREFNLSYKFSNQILKQAEKIEINLDENELKSRIDFRNKTVITIDPADAKDFDDAVSLEMTENGNYRIGIHIADVSHYIPAGSPIDNEAYSRGTSVYFVGKVIPMLPERLSNNICSLVPNEDRLTYSVIVEMTPRGRVIDYLIAKTVINSKRRFTYDEVQEIIESGKGDYSQEILKLNKISQMLRKQRMKSGSINFHTPEVEFKLDDNGVPLDIKVKKVKESHNLIEELMLLANKIIGEHISKSENKNYIPFVYRIHDLPEREKLIEFSSFVKTLGYSFDPSESAKSTQFQKLLEQVKGTEEEALINEIAIRSMAKAVYSTDNIGHYGLGFKYYTHFTSPIRRYPDLIAHRLIFDYIENKKPEIKKKELQKMCEHASAQERNAINAERLSVKLKQLEFLKNRIGEEFSGVISGIIHFGLFIKLSHNLAEGLIRLRDLEDDFYEYDEKKYAIIGRHSGKKFRLGDKVNVKLIEVDEDKREIDFILS